MCSVYLNILPLSYEREALHAPGGDFFQKKYFARVKMSQQNSFDPFTQPKHKALRCDLNMGKS